MPVQDAVVAEVERTIVAFAVAQDYAGLQEYILKTEHPSETIISAIWALLNIPQTRGAYLVSKLLYLRGIISPVISFALFFGGIDMGNAEDAEAGRKYLRAQYEKYSSESKNVVYSALEPLILQQISLAFGEPDYTTKIMQLLDLMKQIVPEFRTRFDLDTAPVPLDIQAMTAAGRARARLLAFAGPNLPPDLPLGSARHPRRAIVALREFVFPHFNNSRRLEQGQTMVAALDNYGWNARFLGIQFNMREEEDARAIVAACFAEKPDLLVLDAVILNFPRPVALLSDLRRVLPNLKIVGVHFDAWSSRPNQLRESLEILDLIWTVTPDMPIWTEPMFKDRVVQFPLPRGGDFGGPVLPLQDKITFNGGVAAYNWHRALWLAGMRTVHMPIESYMGAFLDDGLTPLESYQAFMRRLADGRCGINFSMRQDMTTMSVTARSFEILAVGSLLVQERAPEMDCYFVEGEHYLGFSSIAELRGIRKFIAEQPQEAERVRRRGYAFLRSRYHDDKIIGYLDRALYGA